jgi:hypothetical protein
VSPQALEGGWWLNNEQGRPSAGCRNPVSTSPCQIKASLAIFLWFPSESHSPPSLLKPLNLCPTDNYTWPTPGPIPSITFSTVT